MEMESVIALGIFFVVYTGLILMIVNWMLTDIKERLNEIDGVVADLVSEED